MAHNSKHSSSDIEMESNVELPDDVILRVDNVSKKFCKNLKRSMLYGIKDLSCNLAGIKEDTGSLRKDEFWAVKDISFELKRGEVLGLVGHNGSGKSTLLRVLTGVFPPDCGTVTARGRIGALIALGAGFHPHFTGRENVFLNGSILGLSQEEIKNQLDEIIDFSEIGEFIDAPVSTYSSGMRVRLGFAVATAMKPDLLVIDEVLAVGDMGFVIKCLNRISEIIQDAAVIFVSHNMPMVSRISSQLMLMNHGEIQFLGSDTAEGINQYLNYFEKSEIKVSGTRNAELISIELLNSAQVEVNCFDVSEGFLIKLRVAVDVPFTQAELALYIYNQEFRPVVILADSQYESILIENPNGDAVDYTFTVPRLNLKAGQYSVTVAVIDHKEDKCLLRVDHALDLEMRSDRVGWADVKFPCDVQVHS